MNTSKPPENELAEKSEALCGENDPVARLVSIAHSIHDMSEELVSSEEKAKKIRELSSRIKPGNFIKDAVFPLVNMLKSSGVSAAEELRADLWSAYKAIDGPVLPNRPVDASTDAPDHVPQEELTGSQAPSGGAPLPSEGGLKLESLQVSTWNRSYGIDPDADYVNDLAANIEKEGMLQPIVLVRIPDEEGHYAVLCGAHRMNALKKIRGEDGVLALGELNILPDLTEDDPRCLHTSAAENVKRRDLTPYQLACLIERLVSENRCQAVDLSRAYDVRSETVSQLRSLPANYSELPKSWRLALNSARTVGDRKRSPSITMTHWGKVAAAVKDMGVTPELRAIMEQCAEEGWTTDRLRKRVNKLTAGEGEQGADEIESDDPVSPDGDDFDCLLATLEAMRSCADPLGPAMKLVNEFEGKIQDLQKASEAA